MTWWGWMVIGAFLMVAELVGAEAAFYLIFIGAAAFVMGVLGLAGVDLPLWGQWIAFAVLAVSGMVLFRKRLYDRFRGGALGWVDGAIGETVRVTESVAPGARTSVIYRGTTWTATNTGGAAIHAGGLARIVQMKGIELLLEPAEGAAASEGERLA